MRFPRGPATVKLSKPSGCLATDSGSGRLPAVKMCGRVDAHREAKPGDLPEAFASQLLFAREGKARRSTSAPARLDFAEGSAGAFFLGVPRLNTTECDSSTRLQLPSRLLSVIFLTTLAVCGSSCKSGSTSPAPARTVVDELGRNVLVPDQPQRIVSLAPSVTEILFALGVDDRVAGVTSFCDYPPDARQKPIVGDTLKPSVEKILALKADLVIISTASQVEALFQQLVELGIPVYVSNPRSIDGVLESITRIGELVGVRDRAIKVTDELRGRIDAVEARVANTSRPPVFVIVGTQPLMTAGSGSFITDLINRSGGQSISADDSGDYPQYSIETVVAKRPEIIFLQAGGNELPPRLRQTPAAGSNRVYHIDDDLLLRPGPRIVDGLERIAAKIHPEQFERPE